MRIDNGNVFYTPIRTSNTNTAIPEKSIASKEFVKAPNDINTYTALRDDGVTRKEIIDTIKQLNPGIDAKQLSKRINSIEISYQNNDIFELRDSVEENLNSLPEEFRSHFESMLSSYKSAAQNMQTEYLMSISKLQVNDNQSIIDAFNIETEPNQDRVDFKDSGISDNSRNAVRFTSLLQQNDTVLTTTKTRDEDEFRFINKYSPQERSMNQNFNTVSDSNISASSIAKTQAEIAENVSGNDLSKPSSIIRKQVINADTVGNMNNWFKANINITGKPSNKATTLEKVKSLNNTRPAKVGGKVQNVAYKNLSAVENFLLNTPNGGMTRKMLDDIDNKLRFNQNGEDTGEGIASVNIRFVPDPDTVKASKPKQNEPYTFNGNFIIDITYKTQGDSTVAVADTDTKPKTTVAKRASTPAPGQRQVNANRVTTPVSAQQPANTTRTTNPPVISNGIRQTRASELLRQQNNRSSTPGPTRGRNIQ